MDNEQILTEYYRKRKAIEDSFYFRYHGTVAVKVKNLTQKYTDKLNTQQSCTNITNTKIPKSE